MEPASHNFIYFTTATILNWNPILKSDDFKDIIISSFQYLTKQKIITLFAFVIMPNHLHVIWDENEGERKENARSSFFKYTSHQFLHRLRYHDETLLNNFQVNKRDRKFQFWMRNTLDIEISSDKIFDQKLDYIHNNPLQEKWQLVDSPVDYKYSSANYYDQGVDEFGILTDYYLS